MTEIQCVRVFCMDERVPVCVTMNVSVGQRAVTAILSGCSPAR